MQFGENFEIFAVQCKSLKCTCIHMNYLLLVYNKYYYYWTLSSLFSLFWGSISLVVDHGHHFPNLDLLLIWILACTYMNIQNSEPYYFKLSGKRKRVRLKLHKFKIADSTCLRQTNICMDSHVTTYSKSQVQICGVQLYVRALLLNTCSWTAVFV